MIAAIPVLAACATIMHGTSQDVGIFSSPTGAQVTVDGAQYGVTPVDVSLKRNENHTVKIALQGYQPFEMVLTHSVSGWVWVRLLCGDILGLAVDAITGGLYKLNPAQAMAELHSAEHQVAEHGDVLLVTVVMHASPGMQRIGTLKPLGAR